MNRHAVDLEGHRERASATPDAPPHVAQVGRVAIPRPGHVAPRLEGASDPTLAGRQRWLAGAITAPAGVEIPLADARAALTDGPRLDALERLEIYRRGYRARLVECLADDYPVLRHALGAPAFEALCDRYLARFPSRSPSLNFFGRHMESLCRARGALPEPAGFFAELAALEWAVVEVIHAPSAPPLTPEGLRHVAPDGWARARLVGNTAVRLLRFEHPVNAYFQSLRDGGDPPRPAPADSATVVYRSGSAIWRADLTAPMHAVLSALLGGEPLGEALARAEPGLAHLGEEAASERVGAWFGEWVSSGLFVAVEVEGVGS